RASTGSSGGVQRRLAGNFGTVQALDTVIDTAALLRDDADVRLCLWEAVGDHRGWRPRWTAAALRMWLPWSLRIRRDARYPVTVRCPSCEADQGSDIESDHPVQGAGL